MSDLPQDPASPSTSAPLPAPGQEGLLESLSVRRLADRFSALGHEARLQVIRHLLSHHPDGLVAGELQRALDIPASTLSHHLEALHQVGLVIQRREGRFLRYRAATDGLREILDFLYGECCTRSGVVSPESLGQGCCD